MRDILGDVGFDSRGGSSRLALRLGGNPLVGDEWGNKQGTFELKHVFYGKVSLKEKVLRLVWHNAKVLLRSELEGFHTSYSTNSF